MSAYRRYMAVSELTLVGCCYANGRWCSYYVNSVCEVLLTQQPPGCDGSLHRVERATSITEATSIARGLVERHQEANTDRSRRWWFGTMHLAHALRSDPPAFDHPPAERPADAEAVRSASRPVRA